MSMAKVKKKETESPAATAGQGWAVTVMRPVQWLMKTRLYPGVFQAVSVAIFGLVVYFGIFGTIRPSYNFATVVTWTIWWPLLPVSLLLMGRVWCAICPLVPAISLTQRLAHPQRTPGVFLRRYGIWIMGLLFVLLTWADRVWRITSSPMGTALLLLSLLVGAVAFALVYQRRVFCRYICPIGAFTGLYAMTSAVELRSKGPSDCQECGKWCYRGNVQFNGCPLYQYVRTMDTNRNCNLCGECVKTCAWDVVEVRARPPGRELWQLRTPLFGEALLVMFLVGIVFMQTADMSTAWGKYMRWLMDATGLQSYNLLFSLTFLAALGGVAGAYLLATRWGATQRSWRGSFAAFGYAYIPLALATHLGHNTIHLAGEGTRAVDSALRSLGIALSAAPVADTRMAPMSQGWAVPVILLGGLGSLYVAWRISRKEEFKGWQKRFLPHAIFLLVLTGVFIELFLIPMNPRHAH